MASKGFARLALIWFCLLKSHPVRGRDVPKDESMETRTQNRSISFSNSLAHARPQATLFAQCSGCDETGALSKNYQKKQLALDKSISSFRNLNGEMVVTDPNRVYHWAVIQSRKDMYTNVKATINVYGVPKIKANQFSSAEIWFSNGVGGPPEEFNSVQAGWHVQPELYGDYNTHFFTYWTVDGYQNTGCYNLICEGFVRNKASQLVPGNILQPPSTYNGDQYFITLRIEKDIPTGAWQLYSGVDANNLVGYWPLSLFNTLTNTASRIDVGGTVSFIKGDASPPMGSGHHAVEGERKAASIDVAIIDFDGNVVPLRGTIYVDRVQCYSFSELDDTFYFGGPGGCKD